MFVGSACVMLLVQRRPRTEAIPTRLFDVYVQLLVTAASLGVVFAFNDLPLTWIVLLPAVWAGLTMGPWTSAAYSLTGTLAVVFAQTITVMNAPAGQYDLEQHPGAGQPDDGVRLRGPAAVAACATSAPTSPTRSSGDARRRWTRPACSARSSSRSTRPWC